MSLKRSFSIKINIRWIVQAAAFYSFLALVHQSIAMNGLPAPESEDDKLLQDVKVIISGATISLEQAFALIEQQTELRFFYIKEDLPLTEKIIPRRGEESLGQILKDFGKEFGLAFNRINNQIVVTKAEAVQLGSYTVQGIVRDESTREPLIFATIFVEGTQQGTTTDEKGTFTLVLTRDPVNLRCSYVGYKTEIIPISASTVVPLTISLFSMDMLLQDVTVYAHRLDEADQTEASILSLQSEKIKDITSMIPDVMRSIQMLPGVSTNNELSAKFNVRGGNQDENLVLVNGTQVYDPFHLRMPNASIGIFNVDIIKKIDLLTGGFTARYGDKMSSVLNIEYREGSREKFKGIANVRMTDIGTTVEGPLGKNGSFIVGGRKCYFKNILSILNVSPDVHISFYDIQGVLGYSLNPQQKLLLKFILAGDNFTLGPRQRTYEPSYYTTHPYGYPVSNMDQSGYLEDNSANDYSNMVALQGVNILSSSAILKSEVSLYDQRDEENSRYSAYYDWLGVYSEGTLFYNTNTERLYTNNLQIRTLEVNSTLDLQLGSSYGIKTGASYQRINYLLDQNYSGYLEESRNDIHYPDTTFIRRAENYIDNMSHRLDTKSNKVAGYLENIIQLSDSILLNVGGRLDFFDLNNDLTWSPRIAIAYRTELGAVVRGAWGYYYQSPIYRQIANPTASDTNTQSQRAIHYILGADYDLMIDQENRHFAKFKVEGYYKKYDQLVTSTQSGEGFIYYSRKNDATGAAWGFDVYVAYSYPGFYGWISYSYLTANETLIRDTIGHSFPRNTDQRHTLAATCEVELGSKWKVNTRFAYGSGYPFTPSYTVYDRQGGYWMWVLGSPNSDYLPAYTRIDLRITKDFEIFGKSTSAYVEVNNIFNIKNVRAYRYLIDGNGSPYREEIIQWPILPSLGITVQI
jgi:hypothetical protein